MNESTRSTRRRFLASASAAVAAPYVIPSNVFAAAPSKRINTALIGSGGRGQQIIAGGDRVLAVCDVDDKHCAAAKAKIDALTGSKACAMHKDFRDILVRDDIDGVVIAVPDHWHVPIAMAAAKAGKAVYVEKPLSLYISEGRQLADAVRQYRTILQVGSQQRSPEYPYFTRACEMVRNGRIGELKKIRVTIYARAGNNNPWRPQAVPPEMDFDMWLGQAPYSPYHKDRVHYKFRFVTDFSGGDMTNWGAHHLDIAQWALDADNSGPIEISGTGKRNASGIHDTFYDIAVDMKYANGVPVELRSGGKEVKTGGVRFEGTEGWIFVSRDGMQTEPASLRTTRIGPNEIHLASPNRSNTHMGNWLDCVRKRSGRGLNVPAETGHRSATVCHLANLCMELERPLKWDPVKEEYIGDDEANRTRSRPARQPWRV